MVYALAFVFTLIWALWDVGLDFWPLFSRLFMFGVLAFLAALAYPWLKKRAGHPVRGFVSYSLAGLLAVALVAGFGYTFVPTPLVAAKEDIPVKTGGCR